MKFKRERFIKTLNHKNRLIFVESLLQRSLILINLVSLILLIYYLATERAVNPTLCLSASGVILGLNLVQAVFIFYCRSRWIEIEKQADVDGRTGLLNRIYFDKALEQEVRRAGRYHFGLTLCVLDLDGFGSYNENFGQKRADELLKKFSDFLRASIRFTDSVCYDRADQFCILLPHTDLIRAQKFLSRVLAHSQERLDVSFSGGLTAYHSGESPLHFFSRASLALKQAKREGKKQIRCLVHGEDSHAVISF